MLAVVLSLLLIGCGGGGGSAVTVVSDPVGNSGYTFSGKITLSDGGDPVTGATVSLYKTEYSVYEIGDGLYGTKNPNSNPVGAESIKRIVPAVNTVLTDILGAYSLHGIPVGTYSLVVTPNKYVYKWALVPTQEYIGLVTITDDGSVCYYIPEGTNTRAKRYSPAILYNLGEPLKISNKTLEGLDFKASLPGSSGI